MKFTSLTNRTKGFTLIELLVVIAIIGILSSVVLASLSTARQKARDATRISDIKNVQLALELYYDGSQSYPPNVTGGNAAGGAYTFAGAQVLAALVPTYIPKMPVDPTQTAASSYHYLGVLSSAAQTECNTVATCQSYGLGATLERTDNSVLNSDIDTTKFAGYNSLGLTNCGDATDGAAGTEHCYSIMP